MHSLPVGDAISYSLTPHGSTQRLPARVAPGVQSESRNGVFGVGSMQLLSLPLEHFWQAALHGLHSPRQSAYRPSGQVETQLPPSRIGLMVLGQVERMQGWETHEVHSALDGPVHVLHEPLQAWHTRSSSAK